MLKPNCHASRNQTGHIKKKPGPGFACCVGVVVVTFVMSVSSINGGHVSHPSSINS